MIKLLLLALAIDHQILPQDVLNIYKKLDINTRIKLKHQLTQQLL